MFDLVISNGRIVDGAGGPWYRGDVGVSADRIAAIGKLQQAEAKTKIDAADKVVCPGFIDSHVHGDLMLLADPFHEPAIRQGVTTYIIGQDGVAMAPGSPATLKYMRRYTAGFSGMPSIPHTWETIGEYLACLDRHCAINACVLIPNGNLRHEVMGLEIRQPTSEELKKMGRMVREGMEQGAVGLSTGLDYIPSRYADTEELIALCREMAPLGGVYVTHMRRYDAEGLIGSMDEVFRIGREAGVAVHISHFNSKADLALPKVDEGRRQGIEVTYDLYCYLAGSSILGMVGLPPFVQEGGIDATLKRLGDLDIREKIREWTKQPRGPLAQVRLSFVAADEYRDCEGMTLEQAADETGSDLTDFICEVLTASKMAVCCVAPHQNRTEEDMAAMMRHPAMMGGSDGIFTGGYPHPRGCGCFARYLGYHVRDRKTWTLEEAVQHLTSHPAARFGLVDRGLLRKGMIADIAVFDPDAIADQSTYDDGDLLATGMHHVIVNGALVLHNNERTGALPGRALAGSN